MVNLDGVVQNLNIVNQLCTQFVLYTEEGDLNPLAFSKKIIHRQYIFLYFISFFSVVLKEGFNS